LQLLAHALNSLLLVFLTERAWALLGTERGWIEGSCDMASGLPAWFALDAWFPALFGVAVPCGYTPLLWLNISMAEALLVVFGLGALLSLVMTATSLRPPAAT
jgi:disulfide bond formation protein DsbB